MDNFRISINQIEIFLTVARSRSISVAAKKLYLTQPALSKWLHELERAIGRQLFIRNNRGVELSPDGELLYAKLHDPYHRFRLRIEQIALEAAYGEDRPLRVGCLHDPEIIAAMNTFLSLREAAHPGEPVVSDLYNFRELREKLLFGELDIIFTLLDDISASDGICTKPLHGIDLYFWTPRSWSLPPLDDASGFGALSGKNLLLEMRNGRDAALTICRMHGFEPARVKYVSSFLLLTYMVAQGDGFTLWGGYMPEVYEERLRRDAALEGAPKAMVTAAWREDDASPRLAEAVGVLGDPALAARAENALLSANSRW